LQFLHQCVHTCTAHIQSRGDVQASAASLMHGTSRLSRPRRSSVQFSKCNRANSMIAHVWIKRQWPMQRRSPPSGPSQLYKSTCSLPASAGYAAMPHADVTRCHVVRASVASDLLGHQLHCDLGCVLLDDLGCLERRARRTGRVRGLLRDAAHVLAPDHPDVPVLAP